MKSTIPCPTVYPEVTTHYADDRKVTRKDVPCEGKLYPCMICGEVQYCGREARCLKADDNGHWIKMSFGLGEDAYNPLKAWTQGERWNGWQCPRFEKPEADRLMNETNELGDGFGKMRYDEATDTYTHQADGAPDDETDKWEGCTIHTPEGDKRIYAIGAWSWTWEEVREWTVEAIVNRMKAEIRADFASGRQPATVKSFTDLHDHVDANEYGGLCDKDCPFDAGKGEDATIINRASAIVDKWLRQGRP